jgi:predicted nucleic acid-binding protein
VCRDADDDKFFWCAAAASADYIVSEDRDILAVEEYEGSRTISAADFLHLE